MNIAYSGILTNEELKKVESYIPTIQAMLHFSFKAKIIDNSDNEYHDSIILLSEHMITICIPGIFGWGYSILKNFHIFDLISVNVVKNDTVHLEISDNSSITYIIVSENVIQFIRYLIRNFLLSNPNLPCELRFKFNTINPDYFPPLMINLSPSQAFQTTYHGYCSYYGISYFHNVVLYYHN